MQYGEERPERIQKKIELVNETQTEGVRTRSSTRKALEEESKKQGVITRSSNRSTTVKESQKQGVTIASTSKRSSKIPVRKSRQKPTFVSDKEAQHFKTKIYKLSVPSNPANPLIETLPDGINKMEMGSNNGDNEINKMEENNGYNGINKMEDNNGDNGINKMEENDGDKINIGNMKSFDGDNNVNTGNEFKISEENWEKRGNIHKSEESNEATPDNHAYWAPAAMPPLIITPSFLGWYQILIPFYGIPTPYYGLYC